MDLDSPTEPVEARFKLMDALDQTIVGCLRAEPRMPNKEIASKTGYSESTIANRIRALTERKAIKILLQKDFRLLGWNVLGYLYIQVEAVPVDEVARQLEAVPELLSVTILAGTPQICCLVAARDNEHFSNLASHTVGAIKGIGRVEQEISTKVVKYRAELTDLSL